MDEAIRTLKGWIQTRGRARLVALTNIHGVTECQRDPRFREVLEETSLSLPDGKPLLWIAKLRGLKNERRVSGPDLLWEFCRDSHHEGYSHYFYGGAPGVPEALAERLKENFPGMRIAGTCSPPFRPLTPEEDANAVDAINQAAPDILWVGLGCPKQENWMYEHRERLKVPVIVAVGLAFDVHAGRTRRAPRWMGDRGLEWIYRLGQEPRRLWRRYLVNGIQFAYWNFLELTGLRKFETTE